MDEELKPCPMCGDTSIDYYYEDDNEVSVLCHNCRFETHIHRTEKAAARAWNALPRKLRWTREKPTKEGWYWHRWEADDMYIGGMMDMVYVYCSKEEYIWRYRDMKGHDRYIDERPEVDGLWAGPIPMPEEDDA